MLKAKRINNSEDMHSNIQLQAVISLLSEKKEHQPQASNHFQTHYIYKFKTCIDFVFMFLYRGKNTLLKILLTLIDFNIQVVK